MGEVVVVVAEVVGYVVPRAVVNGEVVSLVVVVVVVAGLDVVPFFTVTQKNSSKIIKCTFARQTELTTKPSSLAQGYICPR